MKLKTIYKIFIFLPLLLLTSCFDAVEEVNLNEDGSGSFAFTINMSQSSAKIAAALLVDSINGRKVPSKEEINTRIKELATLAEKIQGISAVKTAQNFETFVFSFRCSFSDLTALNRLLEEVKRTYHQQALMGTKHFEYDKKTNIYTRNGTYVIGDAYGQLTSLEKSILSKASIVSICRFNSEVISSANPKATIAPSKKAVLLRVNAAAFVKGTETISNKITLLQ